MGQSAQIIPFTGPSSLATWPIAGDASDLKTIVNDQAATIAAQMVLAEAYQAWLNTSQAPPTPLPAAIGTGTANAAPNQTQLNVTVSYNSIVIGATLTDGATIPAGTVIVSQQSGTPGGTGTYVTNNPTTASGTLITFTPPPPVSPWPTPVDAPTLMIIQQDQTAMIRTLSALLQQYQILLNDSQTPPPATGP